MKRFLSVLLSFVIVCSCFSCMAMTSVSAATSTNWSWPTSVHSIKSDWPTYSSGSYHGGTDFAVPLNSPVYSTCDGEVVSVKSLTTSYGKHIKIKATVNGSTVYMRYCHLNSFSVSEGDKVVSGQLIGYSGSTGPHLHYEVRNANDYYGNTSNPNLNPKYYLPGTSYYFDTVYINPPQEPEIKYWYEDLELVNLGDNFSARIRNIALDVLLTNFNGNVVVGKHYDYKIARQIWNFTRNSDGSYKIKSCLNDYCMELHNFDDFDGGNITCIPSNGSTAQDWFIYLNSDGSYSMRPKCSNERVIDVTNGDPTDGNNLQLWNYLSNDNQKFSIEKCGEVANLGDVFAASIEHTDYWKPIYQNDTGNVELTTSSREKMQGILWYFDRDETNGWYTITSYKNAKCLEVEDNSSEPGANVRCGDYVGSHGQHWYILKAIDSEGTEYYYMKSACSSNNLDLDNNSEIDGTNIKMWTLNGSDAQKYSIYKIHGETSYSISAMNKNIELGDTTDIIINDTTFVTSYKFHIVAPDGTESIINNNCDYIYSFKPNQTGRYIIYGEVESPISKDIGSITDRSVEIIVSDHNYTSKITKQATCTKDGTKTYTCSTCGDTYTETIPATRHTIVIDEAVPPTATESGLTQGEHCEVCGEILVSQEVIKPLGIIGDVDGDGKVTIKDSTTIQKHLTNALVLDDASLALADANGDSTVNITDATHIQKYLAQLIDKLG